MTYRFAISCACHTLYVTECMTIWLRSLQKATEIHLLCIQAATSCDRRIVIANRKSREKMIVMIQFYITLIELLFNSTAQTIIGLVA